MSPKAGESTIRNYSHTFVDRKGGAILIKKLDDSMHQALITKYLDPSDNPIEPSGPHHIIFGAFS